MGPSNVLNAQRLRHRVGRVRAAPGLPSPVTRRRRHRVASGRCCRPVGRKFPLVRRGTPTGRGGLTGGAVSASSIFRCYRGVFWGWFVVRLVGDGCMLYICSKMVGFLVTRPVVRPMG